jgi:hypothetical protein
MSGMGISSVGRGSGVATMRGVGVTVGCAKGEFPAGVVPPPPFDGCGVPRSDEEPLWPPDADGVAFPVSTVGAVCRPPPAPPVEGVPAAAVGCGVPRPEFAEPPPAGVGELAAPVAPPSPRLIVGTGVAAPPPRVEVDV